MKQGVEKEDVYSFFSILFHSLQSYSLPLFLSLSHLIFFPPYSHLFIFSIYHPLLRPPFIFFFIILLPLENHREERKYFFLKPNYDLLDSGKKKKNFTSNIPPIIFRNILASQYFPLLYFPRKEEK